MILLGNFELFATAIQIEHDVHWNVKKRVFLNSWLTGTTVCFIQTVVKKQLATMWLADKKRTKYAVVRSNWGLRGILQGRNSKLQDLKKFKRLQKDFIRFHETSKSIKGLQGTSQNFTAEVSAISRLAILFHMVRRTPCFVCTAVKNNSKLPSEIT